MILYGILVPLYSCVRVCLFCYPFAREIRFVFILLRSVGSRKPVTQRRSSLPRSPGVVPVQTILTAAPPTRKSMGGEDTFASGQSLSLSGRLCWSGAALYWSTARLCLAADAVCSKFMPPQQSLVSSVRLASCQTGSFITEDLTLYAVSLRTQAVHNLVLFIL